MKVRLLILIFFCIGGTSVHAQTTLSLSVTPTLFEMSASPGQEWKSSIKVINPNPYDIVVYAHVVNFAPEGESGNGRFLPVLEQMTEGTTLAEWVHISNEPITIEKEKTVSVPFSVEVPEDASPGGHFAAILVGTKPPEGLENTFQVQTAQIVTSLFFVRIAGDVSEQATIRSFRTIERFVQIPEVDLELRFENKGNVHLQPRGDITIYNMWGKKRGEIPINQHTHFGNVLPQSIRQFNFSWKGESSITDIGRYKAVVSLGYGAEAKQFVTSTIHFWVVPLKTVALTLISVVFFVYFVSWCVRRYVRRMLYQAGIDTASVRRQAAVQQSHADIEDVTLGSYKAITSPVRSGITELRTNLKGALKSKEKVLTILSFVVRYKLFFFSACVLVLCFSVLTWYVKNATVSERNFEVTINNADVAVHLSSEELALKELAVVHQLPGLIERPEDQAFSLHVLNRSGNPGTAAEQAILLMEQGLSVQSIATDEGRVDKRTVVVYDTSVQEEALAISRHLEGALLSARSASSTEVANITVFVGEDAVSE